MALAHPTSTDAITPDYINLLLATANPSASVTAVRILDAKTYGEQMVSTAGRVAIEVDYAAGSPADIPTRLVIKLTRAIDEVMAPFYANEVAFYLNIRPELTIEAPRCYGGDFNAESTHFGLLLEDLTERGATFPNTTQRTGRYPPAARPIGKSSRPLLGFTAFIGRSRLGRDPYRGQGDGSDEPCGSILYCA